MQGPRYISRQLLMLTASGDYAQLVECKIIALDTEKRPLAEQVIKRRYRQNVSVVRHLLFVVISDRSTRLCFAPPSRVARLAGAPSLHVNRPLVYSCSDILAYLITTVNLNDNKITNLPTPALFYLKNTASFLKIKVDHVSIA